MLSTTGERRVTAPYARTQGVSTLAGAYAKDTRQSAHVLSLMLDGLRKGARPDGLRKEARPEGQRTSARPYKDWTLAFRGAVLHRHMVAKMLLPDRRAAALAKKGKKTTNVGVG